MRTIQMSSYTVGEDCFEAIPAVLAPYQAKNRRPGRWTPRPRRCGTWYPRRTR